MIPPLDKSCNASIITICVFIVARPQNQAAFITINKLRYYNFIVAAGYRYAFALYYRVVVDFFV